mmetsp:Transcript_13096/g.24812  ORF Transcript_13096/g.24812 Transcript_13096/m.24812 type:complete len:287 (+) Transcript_13096:72-932(+)|eukprot:scaffold9766_cov268-Amphora_coffeaeformis.AAC.5
MNGPSDRLNPGLDDGHGSRNTRSSRREQQRGSRGGGTQQSASSMMGGGERRDNNRNDSLLYAQEPTLPGNRDQFVSFGEDVRGGVDSLYGRQRCRPARSISPDSVGNGIANNLLTGPPPTEVRATLKSPPLKSVPGAYAVPSVASAHSSSPGVMASSHDAIIAQKIAAYDNASAASQQQEHIEIAPGITARLRGANETWAALENDFFLPTQCFCCQLDICCIMDANFVLCPECKVVSPMDGCAGNGFDGGVGLGFTFDDLQNWQEEIIRRRQEQQQQQNQRQFQGW